MSDVFSGLLGINCTHTHNKKQDTEEKEKIKTNQRLILTETKTIMKIIRYSHAIKAFSHRYTIIPLQTYASHESFICLFVL